MKEKILVILIAVLVIALGIQGYMLFDLNERLNQLNGQENQMGFPKFKLPKLVPPKPDTDDDFFKDNPWNPYEEMQHMQDEMERLFGDSFSRFHMKSPLGSLSKTPDVDLQEKLDRYIVTVNARGADAKSVNVHSSVPVGAILIPTPISTRTNSVLYGSNV